MFVKQAARMNHDPILGRTIAFAFTERTEDDGEPPDFERLVDELSLGHLTKKNDSEHTRWQSKVKDQPLRRSARSTETQTTVNESIFSSCSSFFRKRWSDPPKSPSDASTPPRKPIRSKSRSSISVKHPQQPTRTSSFDSEKGCTGLRKTLSCSRMRC